MFPDEVVKARKKRPVAYLPIGGIEWHGEHNCLGLDTVKCHYLAIECAKKIGGLVFPPLFYGEPRENYLMEANHDANGKISSKMGLPAENFGPGYMQEKSFQINFEYTKLLHRVLVEIASLGFKVIIIMVGHYPLLYHAKAACALFNLDYARYQPSKAWACSGYELVKQEIPDAGDHAAAWETSLMMALRPDLVDLSRLPKNSKTKLIGVMGRDPRKYASIEFGKKGVKTIVENVKKVVEEILE